MAARKATKKVATRKNVAKKSGKLRKTLPKDLDTLLKNAPKSGNDAKVRAALERCLPNARSWGEHTVLMNPHCSEPVALWAIERGTDVNATNTWGRTALHESAHHRWHKLAPEFLIELGADVHKLSNDGLTPLHSAVDGQNLEAVRALVAHGADLTARERLGKLTPLEYGLARVSNVNLVAMVPVARAMLDSGAEVSEKARELVLRAAETFEFHRENFSKTLVEETSDAAAALCALFSVDPPGRRRMHDGTSPIVATAKTPRERHAELWELLVPSSGPCATVQGEVVRIAGRINDELFRNGGGNWDRDYRKMATAFRKHVGSHVPLDGSDLAACDGVLVRLLQDLNACTRLLDWSVAWVGRNPDPIPLPAPNYGR